MPSPRPNRKARRIEHDAAVTLKVAGAGSIHSNLSNLSTNGAYLQTDRALIPGTLCELFMVIREDGKPRTVRLRAFVVRNDVNGIGLEFVEPDKQLMTTLKAVVAARPVLPG